MMEPAAFDKVKFRLRAYGADGSTHYDTASLNDVKEFTSFCKKNVDPNFKATPMIKVLIDMAVFMPYRRDKKFRGRIDSVEIERIST